MEMTVGIDDRAARSRRLGKYFFTLALVAFGATVVVALAGFGHTIVSGPPAEYRELEALAGKAEASWLRLEETLGDRGLNLSQIDEQTSSRDPELWLEASAYASDAEAYNKRLVRLGQPFTSPRNFPEGKRPLPKPFAVPALR